MQRAPYPWLLSLICVHVLVLGMELPRPWTDVSNLITAPMYAGLLLAIRQRRSEALTILLLAVIAPATNLVIGWGTWVPLDLVKLAFWTAAPAFLSWKIFVAIFEAEEVSRHEIIGALALYILIGLVFANVYEAMFLIDPDALRFGDNFPAKTVGFGEILYFSFVTLSTLGYGDISPSHNLARILAVGESMIGIMYMAVLVARFVSLHAAQRPDIDSHPPPERRDRPST